MKLLAPAGLLSSSAAASGSHPSVGLLPRSAGLKWRGSAGPSSARRCRPPARSLMSAGANSSPPILNARCSASAAALWRAVNPAVKSDIIVFPAAHHDRAVLGQRAGDLDDRLLRFEHLGKAHWPARFHLVADAVGGARRHAAQEPLARHLVDTLEGAAEQIAVDIADQRAQILVVHVEQVVEHEHRLLDLLGGDAIDLGELGHDA